MKKEYNPARNKSIGIGRKTKCMTVQHAREIQAFASEERATAFLKNQMPENNYEIYCGQSMQESDNQPF
jgi:hypothetical protein